MRGGSTERSTASLHGVVGGSTQCVHQICLKLLKSVDADARLSMEVRSLYMEEASAMSEISSMASDFTSMGEISCESDDPSKMANVVLKKKAKKLSLANAKDVVMTSSRIDLHKKFQSFDASTPRPQVNR